MKDRDMTVDEVLPADQQEKKSKTQRKKEMIELGETSCAVRYSQVVDQGVVLVTCKVPVEYMCRESFCRSTLAQVCQERFELAASMVRAGCPVAFEKTDVILEASFVGKQHWSFFRLMASAVGSVPWCYRLLPCRQRRERVGLRQATVFR